MKKKKKKCVSHFFFDFTNYFTTPVSVVDSLLIKLARFGFRHVYGPYKWHNS